MARACGHRAAAARPEEAPAPISPSVGFIDVPYVDTQVQNFQGGFVRPGGSWFRPIMGP